MHRSEAAKGGADRSDRARRGRDVALSVDSTERNDERMRDEAIEIVLFSTAVAVVLIIVASFIIVLGPLAGACALLLGFVLVYDRRPFLSQRDDADCPGRMRDHR